VRTVLACIIGVLLVALSSGCSGEPGAHASSPEHKKVVGSRYKFAVAWDERHFVVDVRSNGRETLFVAKPRRPGQDEHFNANEIVWEDCVYISASGDPPAYPAPLLRTDQDVREYEADLKRWQAANRIEVNNLSGTKFDEKGNVVGTRLITWDLHRGDEYLQVQLDCPTRYWREWGPRMLAIVNSLEAR
jgi:hypothetical protein